MGRWVLIAGGDGALQCNSRRTGHSRLIFLHQCAEYMFGVPCNSIQTNLGLWWPLSYHLFFPPLSTLRELTTLLCRSWFDCIYLAFATSLSHPSVGLSVVYTWSA